MRPLRLVLREIREPVWNLVEHAALQVSNCNPNAIGVNGEQGLMQRNPTFCGAAPNGNCLDLDYNVMTGARLLAAQQ
ncbi:hypothetical protein B0H14DRAFT_3457458 [Mycena olivaceomarginata]|nr:hypothetical protein B0H14DRAFT_3457458 [Mycena olivaceomarginata]